MPPKEIEQPNTRRFKDRNKLSFHIRGQYLAYWWELKNRNGAVIARSNGTYDSIQKVMRSIGIIIADSMNAKIEPPTSKIKVQK